MSHQEQPKSGVAAPAPLEEPALAVLFLHPENRAVCLDIDGTLLDLAETSDAIVIPKTLPSNLNALSGKLGGIGAGDGTPIPPVDTLLSPFHFPMPRCTVPPQRGPAK
jgi:trehalose 6-phosphate phosphatase